MQIVSLIIDGAIILLLAATVFYAAKLSLALKQFRDGKEEFARLLNQLGTATKQADESIQSLQKSTDDSGHDLQLRVNQARSLSEELQLMTEAATNLADRLEKMSERNREVASRMERAAGMAGEPLDLGSGTSSSPEGRLSSGRPGGFDIRDPEIGSEKDSHGQDGDNDLDLEDAGAGDYQSKAEKDLANAIRRRNKK